MKIRDDRTKYVATGFSSTRNKTGNPTTKTWSQLAIVKPMYVLSENSSPIFLALKAVLSQDKTANI